MIKHTCSFSDNYIDGSEFVKLSEAEVKQMVPPIGLAKKIVHLIPRVSNTLSCICHI